jgi:hypothetical protein
VLTQLGNALIPRDRIDSARISHIDPQEYVSLVNREHENVYDAISRKDSEAARAAMRMHLSNSRERLRRVHEQPALPMTGLYSWLPLSNGSASMTNQSGKKALVIGGGAPNSALVAGALVAFVDRGVRFDVISTSGAGALMGLLYTPRAWGYARICLLPSTR